MTFQCRKKLLICLRALLKIALTVIIPAALRNETIIEYFHFLQYSVLYLLDIILIEFSLLFFQKLAMLLRAGRSCLSQHCHISYHCSQITCTITYLPICITSGYTSHGV